MIIYINNKGEIKAVGNSNDPLLQKIEITDDANPFNGWSKAKICCYRVAVDEGRVVMMTPYVDSRLISHFDQVGKDNESTSDVATENDDAIMDVGSLSDENAESVEELATLVDENSGAIEELASLIDELRKNVAKIEKAIKGGA